MAESSPSAPTTSNETEITLGLLNAIHENSAVTQRSVARDLGIALGLANAYLKRCAKKGLIKVAQVPSNRYAYYLTRRGFTEKSRLTAEYLSQSFQFFRQARSQCDALFAECARRNWHRVVLVGTSDLGEIASYCARDHSITIIGFADDGANIASFAGLAVTPDLDNIRQADAAIITETRTPQAVFDRVARILPAERVLTPRLLRISRPDPAGGDKA